MKKIIFNLLFFLVLAIGVSANSLVLEITCDNSTIGFNDTTGTHTLTAQDNAYCNYDQSVGKWYGFLDLSNGTDDRLSGTVNANFSNGVAIGFWVNYQTGSSGQRGLFFFGGTSTEISAEEGTYGINLRVDGSSSSIDEPMGSSTKSTQGQWDYYFLQYDGSRSIYWKNGVVESNTSEVGGAPLTAVGENFEVGRYFFGIGGEKYIDEFQVFNQSNFTTAHVLDFYNEKRLGTPPERDLYVSSDYQNSTHYIVQVTNIGILDISSSFTTQIYYNSTLACSPSTASLAAGASTNLSCAIDQDGYYQVNVTLDTADSVSEDVETNNNYIGYLDYRPFPRFKHDFNVTFLSSGSNPAQSAYNTYKSFVSEDFNGGWSAVDVDPRAKKGYENAINCYLNSYNSTTACSYAYNHLEGWFNGSISAQDFGDATVQATHEVEWLSLMYDVMYNDMTDLQRQIYGQALQDICLAIFDKDDVQPYLDNDSLMFHDNGKGFGSGFVYPCYIVLGLLDENPTSMFIPDNEAKAYSAPHEWNDRVIGFLQSSQGDRCPEGILYCNYAYYHFGSLLSYLFDIEVIDNDISSNVDGVIRAYAQYLLDFNYNGDDLRSDSNQYARYYSFGDTHSYDVIGEMDIVGSALLGALASATDNQTSKDIAYTLWNLLYENEPLAQNTRPLHSIFYYEELYHTANNLTAEQLIEALGQQYVGGTWDYVYARNNYTFANDTIIILDGGDKPAPSHRNAEATLFVYAMGEPFLDYPQVPLEDDVRSEFWHNTVDFSNNSNAFYDSTEQGTPELHQYYISEASADRADYPNANYQDALYRGNISDMFFNASLFAGGSRLFQPYNNTDSDVERQIVYYEDFLVEQIKVNRTNSGYIGLSYLQIQEEFTATVTTDNITFQRKGTDKYYVIEPLYNSTELDFFCYDTGLTASDQKTGSSGLNVTYRRCAFEMNGDDEQLVLLHRWYQGDSQEFTYIENSTHYGINHDSQDISLSLLSESWNTLGMPAATQSSGGDGNQSQQQQASTETSEICQSVQVGIGLLAGLLGSVFIIIGVVLMLVVLVGLVAPNNDGEVGNWVGIAILIMTLGLTGIAVAIAGGMIC